MTESEEALRAIRAARFPQPGEPRDRAARAVAKALFLLCGLLLAAALLWLKSNINWQMVGQ